MASRSTPRPFWSSTARVSSWHVPCWLVLFPAEKRRPPASVSSIVLCLFFFVPVLFAVGFRARLGLSFSFFFNFFLRLFDRPQNGTIRFRGRRSQGRVALGRPLLLSSPLCDVQSQDI
ncbi:hypothetical protein TW95_gp0305 [Pandoravirus inopinatum]|uniref:Transmembrane protein n=1 Tax=Pandoravirus inopinatum TaxID=1605721 RepID=A0A0B5J0P6_9VIRU|nr:hypothetical protein TW95_gp0305 [Pandoravirus inopinatum]AJF97039.1 hypothetical protein [Pandoravirus inopinatum]